MRAQERLITVDELVQCWMPTRLSRCWTLSTNRARRRKTDPKYPAHCRFIWRRISPVSPHLYPADGLCRICRSCNKKRGPGESTATVSSWRTTIPAAPRLHAPGGLYDGRDWPMSAYWMAAMARGLRRTVPHHYVARVAACAGDVVPTTGCMPTIDAEGAADLARQAKLLDARPRAAYVGDPAKETPAIFPEPFMRLQAITSPTENSSRTRICRPALRLWERMDRRKSEFIAVAEMRRRMSSQPCAPLGLRRRFMSDRGLRGVPTLRVLWQEAPSPGRAGFRRSSALFSSVVGDHYCCHRPAWLIRAFAPCDEFVPVHLKA